MTESPHVMDLVQDYLEDRLDTERRILVRAHVERCDECAGGFEFVARLKSQALEEGLRHIRPEQILAAADSSDSVLSVEEASHLEDCEICRADLALGRSLPRLEDLSTMAPSGSGGATHGKILGSGGRFRRSISGTFWVVGGVAAAAALVLLISRPKPVVDVMHLASIEPIRVTVPRSVPDGEFEATRTQAIEAYDGGDFVEAARLFESALSIEPGHGEVLLLHGSSTLQLGRLEEAIASLEEAVGSASRPDHADEARWHLANALLAANRGSEARSALDILSKSAGARAESARRLIRRIEAAG